MTFADAINLMENKTGVRHAHNLNKHNSSAEYIRESTFY